jgi:transcriptional regulator GlxA family with amidase domain
MCSDLPKYSAMPIGCVGRSVLQSQHRFGLPRAPGSQLHRNTSTHTDQTFREFRGPIDTLLVAGSVGPLRYEAGFLEWLGEQSAKARRFGSVCTGALMLAKARLLDGRRATTHWNWCDELARDFPRSKWIPLPSMFAMRIVTLRRE